MEPERVIQNDALNSIAEEYANLEISERKVSDSNVDKISNVSWTEGSSYKEESPLESLQLEPIGSKRRSPGSSSIKTKITSTNDAEPETKERLAPSQCLDFTLLLNGVQIHSKYESDSQTQVHDLHDAQYSHFHQTPDAVMLIPKLHKKIISKML